ncbi:UNVERIFIED_ORG: hypothetical protein [Escherichia phage CMSTMSU]
MSKHPLLPLIIDYVNDYESSRWKFEEGGLFRGKTFYGAERYVFSDATNGVKFAIRNFNSKENDYLESGVKVYIDNNSNVLTYDESLIMLQIMRGVEGVRHNLTNLKIQQNDIHNRQKLRVYINDFIFQKKEKVDETGLESFLWTLIIKKSIDKRICHQ